MRKSSAALTVAALAIASMFACGKTPSAPSPQPVTSSTTTTTVPANVVLNGRLISSITGAPVVGATVDVDGRLTNSTDDGRFRYELAPGSFNAAATVRIGGAGLLERTLRLNIPGSRDVSLDAITTGDGFDLAYYRRMVRDDFDSPGVLRTLRRWNVAPRLYIRTIDELGQPVEAATFDTVVSALKDDAAAWTGGRFGLAGVEMGTESREGVSGWITVKWVAPMKDDGTCARAQVAANGGWIEFNYLQRSGCDCRGSRIGPKTARHELGHAMGFYHTGDRSDVMWGTAECDDRRMSARERLHAAVAYGRSIGNADPDVEPSSLLQRYEPPVVIVD